jgi:tetratricopeptide (TPR) repeat protein
VAVLLALVGFWPKPSAAQYEAWGETAWQKGDLTLAHTNFYQAVQLEPENAGLRVKLAILYEEARDYEKAVQELSQAQTLNPELSLAEEIERVASLRDEPKLLRQELAKMTVILSVYPNFRDGWYKAAYLHYRLKEDDLAREALRKTLELDPNFSLARELERLLQ